MRNLRKILFASILASAAHWPSSPCAAARDLSIQIVSDRRLPAELAWPRDLRWSGDDTVYLALGQGGVVEVSISHPTEPRQVVAPPARQSWDRNAERLALTPQHLVVGSMAFALRWKERSGTTFSGELALEYIGDLDLFHDRLLVVGIRRDDEGRLGADGNIAWLGRLGERFESFRPLLPSRSGPGVATMEACAPVEISVARFLADGSFAIVPGSDRGVFLYDPSGRLRRTWDSDVFGIGDPCAMPREMGIALSGDPATRLRWLNRRRVVEEILPLASGPAAVVRERVGEETVWDLVLLNENGTVETVRLPVTSTLPWARLRGDALGDRLALLIATWGADRDSPIENRLVIARVTKRVRETSVLLVLEDGSVAAVSSAELEQALGRSDVRHVWAWGLEVPPRKMTIDELRREAWTPTAHHLTVRVVGQELPHPPRVDLMAAPTEMWRQVPEDMLPHFVVDDRGRAEVPVDDRPWRFRLVGTDHGSGWLDVPGGQRSAVVLPTTAQRLALRVVGADDQPVVAARLSITDPHPERGNIRKLADYRSGEDGTVRIAGLPPDLDLVLAVTHDHHAPAVLAGRAGSLPSTVRLDAGLALGGRLLDPEARPVSGAEVVVRFWLSDQVPVTLSRRAVSDDEGRWRVAALPAGRVELVVQPKDHAPSSRVLELPRQASEVARITLAQPAIIAVRVVDDLGEPVANAGLSTGTATVSQTDSDGRVQIHAMSDRPLHVSASAPGHLATESDLVPPLPPDLELVLGRSFQIAGRLMDDQGSPVATGNVRIAIGRSIQDAELSPGGGFELDVPPGKPVQLHLLSSHTRELVVDVAPGFAGERRDLGDLTAPVGWAIRGRLLRASDLLPVVGARIWTPRASEKGPLMAWFLRDLLEARSGEEGDFELAGLPPLPTTLRIEAYGLALRRVEVAPGEEASPLELGDILLERGATVSVLAPGAGDGSVARLDVGGRNLPMDFLLAPVEEERAEIPGVPPGSARLSLLAGEEVLCEREVVVGEGEDLVETRCEATPLRVTGRVEMANVPTGPGRLIWGRERLGEPQLPEAVMTFRAGGISQLHTFAARDASVVVQVDADGAFVTSSLRPGRWDVQWMPDEGPSPEPRIVVIGDLEEQEVLLRFAGYAIRGRVIDGEGRPVGGAHVLDHVSRSFDLSAEDGRFGLAVPSGGAHVLQARLHETASSMVEVIVDPEREPELVELVLGEESPEDSLEVRVWSDEELPAPGALVLIELDGSGLRVLTTDSEGIARTILSPPHPPRWRAAALAGTRWVLGDWSESARSMPERDELQLGATGSLVVSADGRSGAVSVATPDGWQVDMLLRWIGASPVVSPERPLTIVGLPVGRYTVSLPPAAVTAEIKEGRTAEVTFR